VFFVFPDLFASGSWTFLVTQRNLFDSIGLALSGGVWSIFLLLHTQIKTKNTCSTSHVMLLEARESSCTKGQIFWILIGFEIGLIELQSHRGILKRKGPDCNLVEKVTVFR